MNMEEQEAIKESLAEAKFNLSKKI